MQSSIANAWDEKRRCPTTTRDRGKHPPPAVVHPAMRPLLLLAALAGCAGHPRLWARPDAVATPSLSPLVAERVDPDPVAPAGSDGAVDSADGRSRTRAGPCQPDGTRAPEEGVVVACTFTPERQWREWRFPGAGQLLDVHDGVALIARPSATGDTDIVRYDIDQGRSRVLTLPEPTARWRRAGFTRSGMLAALVRTGTAEHPRTAWVYGPTDGALTMEALPMEADDLGVEGDVAVCVGASGAAVVSTLGWSRGVEMPPGALRAGAPGEGVGRTGERVRCGAGRCVIDGVARVTLRGEGGGNDPAGTSVRNTH
jgi:hypothetical protein